MCNLYALTATETEIVAIAQATRREDISIFASSPIGPGDYAPIVRNAAGGLRELTIARWGMPSTRRSLFEAAVKSAEKLNRQGKPKKFSRMLIAQRDDGAAFISDVRSLHWRQWLDMESRCLVPFNSFAEFNKVSGGNVWFALNPYKSLGFFAGICTTWTSKLGKGRAKNPEERFGLLSMKSINISGERRRKPMPVILTKQEDVDMWMKAPKSEALILRSSSRIAKPEMLERDTQAGGSSIDC